MILYLSSNEHCNLLDFMGVNKNDTIPVKKMLGNFMLKQFIIYDMRSFAHCTELVLDRVAFSDSDTEFTQGIEEFLTMHDARITVIYEGLTPQDALFSALLSAGVGNIIAGTDIVEIQQEIRECLSEKGMARYAVKDRPKIQHGRESYRFDCERIPVFVLSSQPRMGATTAAVGLSAWLGSVGAKVCYVELNDSRHLEMLARAYEMEQSEYGYVFDGVEYCTAVPQGSFHFIVYDMGAEQAAADELLDDSGILLLCCGTKPYEITHTQRLLREHSSQEAFICCPYVSEELREGYADAFQSNYHRVLFMEYQPDIMNGTLNSGSYRKMVEPYIVGMQ